MRLRGMALRVEHLKCFLFGIFNDVIYRVSKLGLVQVLFKCGRDYFERQALCSHIYIQYKNKMDEWKWICEEISWLCSVSVPVSHYVALWKLFIRKKRLNNSLEYFFTSR